jgi:hypothetical protein
MTIEHVPPNKPFGTEKCKYWLDGKLIRYQYESGVAKEDSLVDGTYQRTLGRQFVNGSPRELKGEVAHRKFVPRSDPWGFALFGFYGEKEEEIPFDRLLAQPHQLHSARKVHEDGRELVYVDLSHKRGRIELWFDPSVNHLVRKYRSSSSVDNSVRVETVASFTEGKPGVFFPTLVKGKWSRGGKHVWDRTVTFANVTINEPFPDELRQFRFPPEVMVFDHDKMELHKTDENGEPTLPPINSEGRLLQVAKVPPMTNPETKRLESSQEEPRSWTRWLLPASLVLLVGAGTIAIVRKLRGHEKTTA